VPQEYKEEGKEMVGGKEMTWRRRWRQRDGTDSSGRRKKRKREKERRFPPVVFH